MTSRQLLDDALRALDDDQVLQVADFAGFLRWRQENAQWRRFGKEQLARAYGEDEPDYGLKDINNQSHS